MRFNKISRISSLPMAALAVSSFSQAAVLISDNFDGVATGDNLESRVPSFVDPSLSGAVWDATTANFFGNGDGGLVATAGPSVNRAAGIDLGSATFFTDNPGIYELSVTIQQVSGTGSSWVGFGFGAALDVAVNQTQPGSLGNPWLINRMSGSTVFFREGTSSLNTGTAPVGTQNLFSLRLNTTGTAWTLDGFINGTQIDLNTANPGTSTYTFGTAPEGLRYLTMSTGHNMTGETEGTSNLSIVDNFTFSAVPEPSAALLAFAGAAGAVFRRRR